MSLVVRFVNFSAPVALMSTVSDPVAGAATFLVRVAGPSVSASLISPPGPARRSYSKGPIADAAGATTTVAEGATTPVRIPAARSRLRSTARPRPNETHRRRDRRPRGWAAPPSSSLLRLRRDRRRADGDQILAVQRYVREHPAGERWRQRTDPRSGAPSARHDVAERVREREKGLGDTDEEPAVGRRTIPGHDRRGSAFRPDPRVLVPGRLAHRERVATEPEYPCRDHAALTHDGQRGDVGAEPDDSRVGDAGVSDEPRQRVDPGDRGRAPPRRGDRGKRGSGEHQGRDRDIGVHLERSAVIADDRLEAAPIEDET